MHHVFVLSGGTHRAAWQAGALSELLQRISPDDRIGGVLGVGTGAFNAGLLASRLTVGVDGAIPAASMEKAVRSLSRFITQHVVAISESIRERSVGELVQRFMTEGTRGIVPGLGWNGLLDAEPFMHLLDAKVDPSSIRRLPIPVIIGFTDYVKGEYHSIDLRACASDEQIKAYVVASALMPIIMDYVPLKLGDSQRRFATGCLRHVLPTQEVRATIQQLIKRGVNSQDIQVHILTSIPRDLADWKVGRSPLITSPLRPGLLHIIDRAFTMMTHSLVEADLHYLQSVLRAMHVSAAYYRSDKEYLHSTITELDVTDITSMMSHGRESVRLHTQTMEVQHAYS